MLTEEESKFWLKQWNNLAEPIMSLHPAWNQLWAEIYADEYQIFVKTDLQNYLIPLAKNGTQLNFWGDKSLYDYNDKLGVTDVSIWSELLSEQLAQGIINFKFNSLLKTSETVGQLTEAAKKNHLKVSVSTEDMSPYLSSMSSFQEYLTSISKKKRGEVRRKLKKVNSEDELKFYQYRSFNEVLQQIPIFFELMLLNPKKKKYFIKSRINFFEKIIVTFAKLGMTVINKLIFNGNVVAMSLCFNYNKYWYLYNSGYNREYEQFSAGVVGHISTIKHILQTDTIKVFDFMRGIEDYKLQLGANIRELVSVEINAV